jgi:hypothetical protein
MRLRSVAERRWWTAAAAAVGAIYASLYPLQFVLDALRERNLLRKSIAAAGVVVALGVGGGLARRAAGWREWAALACCAAVYTLVASRFEVVQERIHLAEYGVVALLAIGALEARAAAGGAFDAVRPAIAAAALTAAVGWLDEGIQGLLPNRYYDLRDVALNAASGALALGALELLRRARRADVDARAS